MSSSYKSSIPVNVPLNYIDHVNIDNMGFVLTLRSEAPNAVKIKQASSKPHEAMHQQSMVSKSNSCTNPLCIGDFDAIQREIIEVENIDLK
ncbi:hypothetical protein EON65_59220 [archaeon]|nr:MAG: hypothetical protein EON65_59220 [archaeon]